MWQIFLYNRREALGSDDGGESQIAMKDVLAQMDAAQLEHADSHAGSCRLTKRREGRALGLRPGESSG